MPTRHNIIKPDESPSPRLRAARRTAADLVRVAGFRWKGEECFQSAKNECGLDQYAVRRYGSRCVRPSLHPRSGAATGTYSSKGISPRLGSLLRFPAQARRLHTPPHQI